MSDDPPQAASKSSPRRSLELAVQNALFRARWAALPIYFGFVVALVLVVIKFVEDVIDACIHLQILSSKNLIVAMLRLVDLSLVANLLIIVMFSGYENFVSRTFGSAERGERPQWLDHVTFAALKRRVLGSIVVISAVDLLERFMDIENQNRAVVAALAGLLLLFAVAAVLLSAMDRIAGGND